MNIEELKANITPIDVSRKYIGSPLKEKYGKLWYKSPFRKERTASFMVTRRGFHDFGDSWHGDIIAFVQRWFGVSFKEAVEILKTDYGLSENEYETPKITQIKKLQREKSKIKQNDYLKWFEWMFQYLCNLRDQWQEVADFFNGRIDLDIYAMALNKLALIDYWLDVFIDYSDRKEELYKARRSVACSLM